MQLKLQDHAHIVPYVDHEESEDGASTVIRLVMRYCPSSVLDLMNAEHPPWETRYATQLALFRAIASAVAHMHAQVPPIVHRDLKVENVLVAEDDTPFLCDFGSASTATQPLTGAVRRRVPPSRGACLTHAPFPLFPPSPRRRPWSARRSASSARRHSPTALRRWSTCGKGRRCPPPCVRYSPRPGRHRWAHPLPPVPGRRMGARVSPL